MAETNGAEVKTEVKGEKNGTEVKTEVKDEKDSTEVKPEVKEEKKEVSEAADVKKEDAPKEDEEMVVQREPIEVTPELEKKILRQVEYYFGDVNLPRDKFLQAQIKEDADGWVTFETMLKFNRLRKLHDDPKVLCDALLKSTRKLIEVSEDHTKIRRSTDKPLPPSTKEYQEEVKARTVYAKGFPLEITLDQLQDFFDEHGSVEHVQFRRNNNREFKGSVFVLFYNLEDAKKFVEAETVKYGETDLIRYVKDDYYKMKNEEKKKLKEDDLQNREDFNKQREEERNKKLQERMTKGAILRVKGLAEDMKIAALKEEFNNYGEVMWVDFDDGAAKIRFNKENSASEALEKWKAAKDGKCIIGESENELETSVLEGEQELEHWRSVFEGQRSHYDRSRNMMRGRGGGRGGRGRGRGGFRKRGGYQGRGGGDDGPPSKRPRTD